MVNPKVLFVCHGTAHKHENPGYRFLYRLPGYCYTTGTYVDCDPECKPTHVLDVTENNVDFFEDQFDYVFLMFAPSEVLKSRQFWWNVMGWLKPGGIVQTIVPRQITRRQKDWMFGTRIAAKTGMRLLEKKEYMVNRRSAIVLTKECAQ